MEPQVQDEDALFEARAKARLGATLRDKYHLDRVLGFGGMATVYAATHRNGKEVALKLLHPELAYNADIRGRFLREGYVANQVKHPGAVSVIDDDVTEEGWAFLVMELLRGSTIQELWERRTYQLHPAWVTAILLQLLDVMAAAHENGIVHRDLKPANLFVTPEGELKVLDFGIARMRDVKAHHTTNAGSVLGTPAFMAPEQAMAKSKEIDHQTDLWAIGGVAFALLVGEVVHPAENTQQTLVLAATRPARELGPLAPVAPAGIVAVIQKALAFNKDERWTSAKEMRAALVTAAEEAYGDAPGPSVLRDALKAGGNGRLALVSEPTIDLPSAPLAAPAETMSSGERETLRGLSGPTSAPASVPVVVRIGTTTSGFVSTASYLDAAPPADSARRHRVRRAAGISMIGVASLAMALVMFRVAAPPAALASSAAGDSAASSAAAAGQSSSVGPLLVKPVPGTELVGDDTTPEVAAAAVTTSSAAASAPAISTARPHASTPKASSSAQVVAPAASAARARCAVPYTIDPASHRKLWKLECL